MRFKTVWKQTGVVLLAILLYICPASAEEQYVRIAADSVGKDYFPEIPDSERTVNGYPCDRDGNCYLNEWVYNTFSEKYEFYKADGTMLQSTPYHPYSVAETNGMGKIRFHLTAPNDKNIVCTDSLCGVCVDATSKDTRLTYRMIIPYGESEQRFYLPAGEYELSVTADGGFETIGRCIAPGYVYVQMKHTTEVDLYVQGISYQGERLFDRELENEKPVSITAEAGPEEPPKETFAQYVHLEREDESDALEQAKLLWQEEQKMLQERERTALLPLSEQALNYPTAAPINMEETGTKSGKQYTARMIFGAIVSAAALTAFLAVIAVLMRKKTLRKQ